MSTGTQSGRPFVSFAARIEPFERGRATYTILRLPEDVIRAPGQTKRVEGEINDYPVNLGIAKADVVDGPFVWTGRTLLDAANVSPGEAVELRLRPAPDDHVEMPDGLDAAPTEAGLTEAGLTAAWEALTPGKRRGLVHSAATAKRPETKSRRVAALLTTLAEAAP